MGRNFIVYDANPIWWHLGNGLYEYESLKNSKQYWNCVRFTQKKSKTWLSQIDIDGEQKYRARKRKKEFQLNNGNCERNAVVKNQVTKQCGPKIVEDCWRWETNGQCSKRDNCSFRHDVNKRAKMTQPNRFPSLFMQQNERDASRTRRPRGKSRWEILNCHARIASKRTTLQNSCSTKQRMGCRFVEKCTYAHRQVGEQSSKKGLTKNGDKSAVAMLKKHESYDGTVKLVVSRDTSHERHGLVVCNSTNTRQLACVLQDMELPKSSSILRKSSDM